MAVVENMVSGALSRLTSAYNDKYDPSTNKSQCRTNELLANSWAEKNEDYLPLNLLIVQRKQ